MQNLKLVLSRNQVFVLNKFCVSIVAITPIPGLTLESFVISEFYKKNIAKLTLPNIKTTISLTHSQAYSFKNFFLGYDFSQLHVYDKNFTQTFLCSCDKFLV